MDYKDVALFTRVIEAGSFTSAAAALGLPKSSVSRGVSRLESDLGVRLVQRTTRRLALTDAGRHFFERVRGAIEGLEEAAKAVREYGSEPRGTVRVTAPGDSSAIGIADAIAVFSSRYPAISVELTLTQRLVDLVGEGFDIAVRAGTLADSTLVARRVGASQRMLFASPEYLERRGRPETLPDLASHEVILFRARGGRATLELTGPNGDESVEVKGRLSADEMGFMGRLATAGAGIALLPVFTVRDAVRRGELEPVLPEYRRTGTALHVVLPSSSFVPARVALLRDFLVEYLAKVLEVAERECRGVHGAAPAKPKPAAPAARSARVRARS
jgi:DNA-binding transcriptional LysR family regulator